MGPPFRSKQEVIIDAPFEAVWSFAMDLTKITEFHPRVVKVDLLAGKAFREPGVSSHGRTAPSAAHLGDFSEGGFDLLAGTCFD